MTESPSAQPSSTPYVVIRTEGAAADSELPSNRVGEWRKRADLSDETAIELLGPAGVVRAYPTGRTERSPAGDVAQVYEVPIDPALDPPVDDAD